MKKHHFTGRSMRICMASAVVAAACTFTACASNELPPMESTVPPVISSAVETELTETGESRIETPLVHTAVEEEKTEIPYETVYEYSDTLYEGEQKIKCEGEPGICIKTVKRHYENEVLLHTETVETVEKEPQTEIIVVGTKNPVTVEEKTEIENIIPHTVETVRDPDSYDDEKIVLREGMDGYTKSTYRITYRMGVETAREKMDSATYPPRNRIVQIGEKPAWHTETVREKTDSVPFTTEYIYDKTVEKGKTYVKTEGKNGYTEIAYQITYYHGKENARKETERTEVKPVSKVVVVGTKEESFMLPYLAWKNYPVTQGYHTSHRALDIGVYYGDPIFASMGGKVVFAYDEGDFPKSNPNWTYGTFVVIEHDNGMRTLYAHLKNRTVRAGQRVTRGQTIGTAGNTGRVTPKPSPGNPYAGTHLHFEIRVLRGGQYVKVNPRDYLPI